MSKTYSTTIEITEEKEYPVTIQAGLDLSSWISAGSTTEYPLNPSSYADFSALEADEAAVRQLMLVHDAVDYLATASAGDSLMQSVIGSDVCAKWINLSDYALDTLSANSDIADEMDTADKYFYGEWGKIDSTTWGALGNVPIMTANNAPYGTASASSVSSSGHEAFHAFDGIGGGSTWWSSNSSSTTSWLQYQFVQPTKVSRIEFLWRNDSTTGTVMPQISNDGTNFTNLLTSAQNIGGMADQKVVVNIPAEKQEYGLIVRLAFNIPSAGYSAIVRNCQFYGRELKPLVPTMTANDKPKGTVSASSTYNNYNAYSAFNGNFSSNGWLPASGTTYPQYIQYDFVNSILPKLLKVQNYNDSSVARNTTIEVRGSNDNFATYDTICNYTVPKLGDIFYTSITPTTNYKALRLYLISGDAGVYGGSGWNLQYYGMDYSEKEFASGSTAKWLYDHGVKPSGALLFNSPWQAGANYNTPIENSNSIDVYNPNNANNDSGFITSNSIAISTAGISNLYCKVGSRLERFYKFVVASTNTGSWGSDLVSQKQIEPPITDTTASLDVSSVSSGYIGVMNYNGSTPAGASYARITELWLE